MIRLMRKYLLGGESDKREGSWLVFMVVTGILVFSVRQEALGVAMPQTWAFLIIAWPVSVAGVIGVHVQHFFESKRDGS